MEPVVQSLFNVQVDLHIPVAAFSKDEAIQKANQLIRYFACECMDEAILKAKAISRMEQIELGWAKQYPYNGIDDLTCEELVSADIRQRRKIDPDQMNLF